jgi:hypothetical protein
MKRIAALVLLAAAVLAAPWAQAGDIVEDWAKVKPRRPRH